MRHFVELADIQAIANRLIADARQCGDAAGADAIELMVAEVAHAVGVTLYELDANSGNGDGAH